MQASDYQKEARRTQRINWSNKHGADIAMLGIIGEIGSLATVVKKHQRDAGAYANFEKHLFEEAGDILWYATTAASRIGFKFENWPENVSKYNDVFEGIYSLHGNIIEFSKKKNILVDPGNHNKKDVQELVTKILENIGGIVSLFGASLSSISQENCDKILSYWCDFSDCPARCFDSDYPWYEQLPRKLTIDFIGIDNGRSLIMVMNDDRLLGDRLTDNSYMDDGYRFHDIFHLAGIVTLGWSPVFRRILKLKRKSMPKIDEIEDGARAAIIEEAVINHVYDYARPNFLEGMKRIDLDLIKRIQNLVGGYEVSACEPWEWQDCIIKSYKIFRLLKKHGCGRIELNAENRSIEFKPLPKRGA